MDSQGSGSGPLLLSDRTCGQHVARWCWVWLGGLLVGWLAGSVFDRLAKAHPAHRVPGPRRGASPLCWTARTAMSGRPTETAGRI